MRRTILKLVSVFALFPLVGLLVLSTCSEIGRQPPELWSARFTEDGSRLVYTYDVYTVFQYSKKGGSTQRSGTRKGFMDVRDAVTGRSLLSGPYSSKNTLNIVAISGDLCALSGYDIKKSRHELSIVDITTGKERFSTEELSQINGGLRFDPFIYYENLTGKQGFVFAAEDARSYFIDQHTGKAMRVQAGNRIFPTSGDRNQETMGPRNARMSFKGQPRQKLVIHDRESEVDFISPSFASALKNDQEERDPVIYNGNPIIISRSTINNEFDWEISMLDSESFDLLWSVSILNVPGVAPFFGAEPLFQLNGDELLVQTSTQLSMLNAATGKLNWSMQVP